MFRKRDTNPTEGEGEINLDLQSEDDIDLQAEDDVDRKPKDDVDRKPKDDADRKPEDDADRQPDDDVDRQPEVSSESVPASPDIPVNVPDLPESQPLSAAPKSTPVSVSPPAATDSQANKRLIVGQGIRLSGEISSCDRLVVEGEVEVTLNDTLALEIASSGRFTGGCEVEEADISGIYEGDLTVRNTLFVRGTGRITGTIRYGQLELERGGQIAGNISVLGNDSPAAGGNTTSKVRSAKAPLFGGSSS